MKIQILSDLHTEFGDFDIPPTDADVIVLAGDIGVGLAGLDWIINQELDKPVIYVLGNHEYYHHAIGLADTIRRRAPGNIHVLDKEAVVIEGVRFLGCTLWTDFRIFGLADKWFSMRRASEVMADFNVIEKQGRCFTPEESIALHEQERAWLEAMLAMPFAGKSVVVTHHFPSGKSIHPRFANDLLTPAFGSQLEDMMHEERVALWIHGHTHDPFDYDIDGTRVVCNPRGYAGSAEGRHFRPDLVVNI